MTFLGKILFRNARRGFTLAEMAIVLGIVMLVFAGVFGVAQVARNRADVNVASNQILQIISNMRDLYMSRNLAVVSGTPSMGDLIRSGVFPVGMLDVQPSVQDGVQQLPSAAALVHHAWYSKGDHSVLITNIRKVQDPANAVANVIVFTLQFLHVPTDVCIELVNNNSTPGPETGLTEVRINTTDFKAVEERLPPPKKELVSACEGNSGGIGDATVEWSFELSL
ncbi:MAG: type 4 pilus major pilin [Bdellovibrionales bacterium]